MNGDFFEAFYEKLGPVGIPLALALLAAVYFGVKIYTELWFVEIQFRRFFRRAENGNAHLLFEENSGSFKKNPLVRVVRDIATKHRHHSDDIRAEAGYLFHKYFYATKRSFAALRLITVCSPLLGLLGTVLGIIDVFEALGASGNATAESAKLALGIGHALWTTALGIIIAVPALAVLSFLKHKFLGCMIVAMEFSYRAVALAKKEDAAVADATVPAATGVSSATAASSAVPAK